MIDGCWFLASVLDRNDVYVAALHLPSQAWTSNQKEQQETAFVPSSGLMDRACSTQSAQLSRAISSRARLGATCQHCVADRSFPIVIAIVSLNLLLACCYATLVAVGCLSMLRSPGSQVGAVPELPTLLMLKLFWASDIICN